MTSRTMSAATHAELTRRGYEVVQIAGARPFWRRVYDGLEVDRLVVGSQAWHGARRKRAEEARS